MEPLLHQPAGPTLLGFDMIAVGTLLAGIAAVAVMVAFYAALGMRTPMGRRSRALVARRDELKAGILTRSGPGRRRQSLSRRTATTDRIREWLNRMKVLQDSQITAIQQKLAHAGYRNRELAVTVILARMILPVALGLLAVIVLYWAELYPEWGPFKRFCGFAAAVIAGYKGPEVYLSNKASKRTLAIRRGLPDALDLLVICAEAGLTVDAAFTRVSRELGRAYPELGEEFALAAIELSFLTERRHAFENLAFRVNLDQVRGVVTTLIQTERYGTPLASSLRVLSAEFRNERMMRAEEKAARLPAIMTVPLILFILPVLFVVILGPAACTLSDAFSNGGLGG
ncbi:pilus assembly protein TadC [Croceibacterium mercuriale]|uniref:Pilus assembly protein TadC n=1 Tax=Croceibacterium mercuriale TaxID=1572751 RepID=A0A0B2BUM3_9SPHN|nr:type II secretion system F family protein [Croceibacterium mercuriale]KHL25258.1 pilus assembly protein TadC [Croceibacterium mercuriale]